MVVGDEMALVSTIQHICMYDTRHLFFQVEHPFVSFTIVLTPKKMFISIGDDVPQYFDLFYLTWLYSFRIDFCAM